MNSFHAAGTRSFINRGQVSSLITPKTIGINVATPVPNYIYMAVSGDFTVSCGTCETYQVTTNSENVIDDIFWTRGKHHFGIGGNFIHNHMNLQGTNNANGQFTFNGSFTGDALADFMLGDLFSLYQGNDTGSTFAKNAFAFYAQDSYQVTPRLTVNAGVRWESDLPEVETAGRGDSFSMAAFMAGTTSTVFKTAPPGLLFAGDPGIPKGYINNHWDSLRTALRHRLGSARQGPREHSRVVYSRFFTTHRLHGRPLRKQRAIRRRDHHQSGSGRVIEPLCGLSRRQSIPSTVPAAQEHSLLPHRRLPTSCSQST